MEEKKRIIVKFEHEAQHGGCGLWYKLYERIYEVHSKEEKLVQRRCVGHCSSEMCGVDSTGYHEKERIEILEKKYEIIKRGYFSKDDKKEKLIVYV